MSTTKGLSKKKVEPLALEEILQKRTQEREAASKPKFLSKEERAKLALENRVKEVELIRTKQIEEKKSREEYFQTVKSIAREDEDRRRRSTRYREEPRSRRDRRSPSPIRSSKDTESKNAEAAKNLTQDELVSIRERYMGAERKKRKIRRMNDRRFVFDWDEGEDTSADANPLYNHRVEYSAFGRGHLGGIDPDDKDYKKNGRRESNSSAHRHWSQKSLSEMKERDWRIFKEDFDISTKGGQIPNPLRSWKESDIPEKVLKVIEQIGYTKPTPIQRQAIPIGLQNRDIIGIAETGSGKTASFLVPMLSFILKLPKITQQSASLGPYALILVPTRELAQQIESETLKFAKPLGLQCISIVGGHAIEEQSFVLSQGVDIVIATPGRLKDCLERHIIVLGQCTYVVMDEADRMIDMGFEADVTFILDQLPVSNEELSPVSSSSITSMDLDQHQDHRSHSHYPSYPSKFEETHRYSHHHYSSSLHSSSSLVPSFSQPPRIRPELPEALKKILDGKLRQTTMFSATMPPQVERLARKYLRRAATVIIGNAGKAVDTVQQIVEFIGDEGKKRIRLLQLLDQYSPPIIVFFNQKRSVDVYMKYLSKEGYHPVGLHGGKSQDLRESSIGKLRRGEADILLATDVAGRGLDVPNVSLVVNFDMAKTIEDYTHRIGRTGRAGKTGTAVSFLCNTDTEVMYDLKNLLLKSPVSKCPPELANHEAALVKPGTFVAKRKYEETLYAK
ncbi:DEAD (Asp-Glu-Ala-Asp) box polypeptide 23 [Coelomomyces lativittatus]|nr:DEAD (Asp-Glu-Ala-Asp) box polypeptide 23 [Coelomomyces lativittatus]KAJ1515932.1 DEAD (Asp-Glu-Ala-Asp) box polypeptide 23 [Coelomomyces lativittatus]KAJ1515962.1 DEAD (Asp-Glu-Ala-Asp) box polypeptide 23 [Coelomomyces lativittatus]